MKYDSKETDILRLKDLAKQHGLIFKRVRGNYRFDHFTAHGLPQALGFAEGFDRARASISSARTADWEIAAQQLVRCDDPQEMRRLESLLKMTREEAVDHYIEDSLCTRDLPRHYGGKGTAAERRAALRALWQSYELECG